MPTIDDIIAQLNKNSEFNKWLQQGGRGIPSWDPTTAGRSGGFPDRLPGMPLAPGTSRMQGGRLGGTYAPSNNMPVPPNQPGRQLVPRPQLIPNATGSNLPVPIPNATGGMQPQLLGAGDAPPLGGAGAPMAPPTTPYEAASRAGNLGASGLGLGALLSALKSTPTAANDTNPQAATPSPGGPVQYGGTLPPAWAAQAPKPFPAGAQAPPPIAQAPPVPMPTPRPQMAQQQVPLPTPRPNIAQQPVPLPQARPQMAQQVPVPRDRPFAASSRSPQEDNISILKALLGSPKAYDHQAVNTANN